jgi:hypothetical protein
MPADHQARTTKAADRNVSGYWARTTKARPLISSTTKES